MKTKTTTPYSLEVRERAVRLVQEHRGEYPSLWAAIEFVANVLCLEKASIGGHKLPENRTVMHYKLVQADEGEGI